MSEFLVKDFCGFAVQYNMTLSLGGFLERMKNNTVNLTHIVINNKGEIVVKYSIPYLQSLDYYNKKDILKCPSFEYKNVKIGVSMDVCLIHPQIFQNLRFKEKVDVYLVVSIILVDFTPLWIQCIKSGAKRITYQSKVIRNSK